MTLDAFLRVWCARGSQGLQADWLKPNERPSFAVVPAANGAPSVAETMAAQAAQQAEPRADPAKARAALALARSALRVMP